VPSTMAASVASPRLQRQLDGAPHVGAVEGHPEPLEVSRGGNWCSSCSRW
jgi:hypothetical protein